MISFISPAKSLDFTTDQQIGTLTEPEFTDEASKINNKIRKLSAKKLMDLQSISRELAEVNYQRNQDWAAEISEGRKQAVLAFKGDVYLGMEAWNWSEADMLYAQDHLRILSGLYGILKPTDAIQAYRLEMGTSISVGRRKDLYHFWGDKIQRYFKEYIRRDELLVNLASQEYFKALTAANIPNPVLDVEFRNFSKGSFKVLSFFAKKARGKMADFIIRNRIDHREELKSFDADAYYFDDKSSTDSKFVFLRD